MLELDVPMDLISDDPTLDFREDEGDIDGLARSIQKVGLINRVILHATGDGKYKILAGRRRRKAVAKLGWKAIPARVVPDTVGDQLVEWGIAAGENVYKDLSPMEQAQAYKRAVEMGFTHQEIADMRGISKPAVTNTLALLTLPDKIQGMIKDQKLRPTDAQYALIPLKKYPDQQMDLARDLAEGRYDRREAARVANSIIEHEALMERFRKAVEGAKHKVCPKCGEEPRNPHPNWQPPTLECDHWHKWNMDTGKVTLPSWIRDEERAKEKTGGKTPPRVVRSTVPIETMARVLTHRCRQLPQYLHVTAKGMMVDFPERGGGSSISVRWSSGGKSDLSYYGWDLGPKGFSFRAEPKKYQDEEKHCTKIEVNAGTAQEIAKQTRNVVEWLEGVEAEARMLDELAQKGAALTLDVANPFRKEERKKGGK